MRNPKYLSLLLSVVMLLTLLAPQAAAASGTYFGDVLLAINTDLSSTQLVEGSFTPASDTASAESLPASVYNICTDPETGETLTILEPVLPPLVPVEVQPDLPILFSQAQAASYEVGSTRSFRGVDKTSRQVECLYVGQHCTVWGNTEDDAAIRIDAAIAQDIGEHFDGYYDSAVAAFGEEYDADGDGRLAIVCYDIEQQYPASANTYTAGLFSSADLADANDRINGIQFQAGTYTNGMDCIHLDTYPGMGGLSDPLGDVPRSYSTLVHEFQHLINFSWSIAGGTFASYVAPMDTYLNEAFSMAAEHMICGADACVSRITYFNGPNYIPGYPLSYWTNDIKTGLSNYANSYLFGQYLRTRYGALTDTNGDTLFRDVLSSRTPENAKDTLTLIADKLNTEPLQLVRDFWAAVYLKQDSGPLGFGGESWADAIHPCIYNGTSSGINGIYNGGVKFYKLGSGSFTPDNVSNLTFLALDAAGCTAAMDQAADGTPVSVTIQTEDPGYAMVAFYDGSGKMEDIVMASITPGTNIVELSGLDADLSFCSWKIFLTNQDYTPMCKPFVS